MSDIGIGIKVEHAEVRDATKALEGLEKKLRGVKGLSDIELGVSGSLTEGLSGGGRRGSYRGPDIKNMDSVTKGARHYRIETEAAAAAWSKIVKDHDKLIKLSTIKTAAALDNTSRKFPKIEAMGTDYNMALKRTAERAAAANPKRKTAAELYFEQHGNYGRTVTSQDGTAYSSRDSSSTGNKGTEAAAVFNRVGAALVGAVTAGSVIGFLQNARHKYIEGAINESRLNMRGITDVGPYLGNTRIQMQAHAESLANQSGYTGRGTLRSVMNFAAATGTDESLGIGVMSRSRDYMNGGPELGKRMLAALQSIAKLTNDSPERINRLMTANFDTFARMQGGALSGGQMERVQAITEALHGTAQGRDPGTMGMMKNAFKSTGDSATDILKFQMLGGYDGPLDFEKLWDIKKREAAGLTDFGNLTKFKELMSNQQYPQGLKYQFASKFLPGMDPIGVEQFVNDTIQGLDVKDLAARAERFKNINPEISTAAYSRTSGAKVRNRQVAKEEMQHAAGAEVEEFADPWERRAYRGIKGAFDSGVPKTITDVSNYVDRQITKVQNEPPRVMPEGITTPTLMALAAMFSGDSTPLVTAIIALTKALTDHPAPQSYPPAVISIPVSKN